MFCSQFVAHFCIIKYPHLKIDVICPNLYFFVYQSILSFFKQDFNMYLVKCSHQSYFKLGGSSISFEELFEFRLPLISVHDLIEQIQRIGIMKSLTVFRKFSSQLANKIQDEVKTDLSDRFLPFPPYLIQSRERKENSKLFRSIVFHLFLSSFTVTFVSVCAFVQFLYY